MIPPPISPSSFFEFKNKLFLFTLDLSSKQETLITNWYDYFMLNNHTNISDETLLLWVNSLREILFSLIVRKFKRLFVKG